MIRLRHVVPTLSLLCHRARARSFALMWLMILNSAVSGLNVAGSYKTFGTKQVVLPPPSPPLRPPCLSCLPASPASLPLARLHRRVVCPLPPQPQLNSDTYLSLVGSLAAIFGNAAKSKVPPKPRWRPKRRHLKNQAPNAPPVSPPCDHATTRPLQATRRGASSGAASPTSPASSGRLSS